MLSKNRHKLISYWKGVTFADIAAREKDHFFLWIPVLLGLGIAVYFGMTTELPVWTGLTCLVISGVTTYYYRNYYIVFLSTLSLTIVFVGFSSAQLRTYYLDTNILPKSFGPAGIQGRIVDVKPTQRGTKITLEDLQITRLRADYVPTRLRLHVNSLKTQVKTGQWISTRAMLKPPPAPSAPEAFDFQRQAYFKQIGAVGFAYGEIRVLKETSPGNRDLFSELRRHIQNRIKTVFANHDNPDIYNLAIALLTGNKQVISTETHEKVRAAGLAHLLTISGLHIGLVSALVFFTVRLLLAYIPPLALRYPIKKWAAVCAIGGALFFTLLTGGSVPTFRAFLMTTIVLTGVLLDRKAISLRTVAWAAIVILLFFPESLMGASFQLSFAAVTALVAYYEKAKPDFENQKLLRYIKGVIISSLIATAATTPFAAYHFNRIALYGIGANLIAIPLTVFWIMPMGVGALLLMPLGLESFLLIPMGWGISALLWVAETTASLPFAQLSIAHIPQTAFALLTFGGILLCLARAKGRIMASSVMISSALLLTAFTSQPDIQISPDGRLKAVQTSKGDILVSDLRRASYVRDSWMRRWGAEDQTPELFKAQVPCDISGCTYDHENGQKVIFNTNSMSLSEDCQKADILITNQASPLVCRKPTHLIDTHSLKTEGAHAIYMDDNEVKVVTTKDIRGMRPWTVYGE